MVTTHSGFYEHSAVEAASVTVATLANGNVKQLCNNLTKANEESWILHCGTVRSDTRRVASARIIAARHTSKKKNISTTTKVCNTICTTKDLLQK